jgi:hypothetical protein
MWIPTFQRRMLPPFFRINYPSLGARIFTNQNQRKGSQQNFKLLSETTRATNGHFLVHNGENCECSMLKYICEVPLCAVLVGKWEIIVPALIYVGMYHFHFPLPNSYGSSMDLQ